MINSFGGNARNRPRVNLGGRRRELTKEELLKKAADDRRLREITRRQEVASKIIQKAWAAWNAKVAAQDLLRQDFDRQVACIVSSGDAMWSIANTVAMQSALRLYYFFFDCKRDVNRTLEIAGYMNINLFGTNAAHRDISAKMMEELVDCALICQLRSDERALIRYAIDKSLKLCPPGETIFSSTSLMLRYYELLANDLVVLQAGKQSDAETLAMVYDHVVRPLRADYSNFYAFCECVLPLPVLEQHTALKSALLAVDLQALISAYKNSVSLTGKSNRTSNLDTSSIEDRMESQLANFINITAARIRLEGKRIQSIWMLAMAASVNRLWYRKWQLFNAADSAKGSMAITSLLNMSNDESDIADRSSKDVELLNQHKLECLSDPALLLALLQPEPADGISMYISSLLTTMPVYRDKLLLTLSVFASSSSSPYNLLQQSYDWWTARMDKFESISGDTIFYLELLSRILLTMVDEEFFDAKKRSFSMDLMKDTAARLKIFGCNLFLRINSDTVVDDGPLRIVVDSCQELVARVLQQIQIRDSRRPFLSQDFWLNTKASNMPILTPQIAFEAFTEEEKNNDDDDEEEEDFSAAKSRHSNKSYVSPKVKLLNNFPFFFPFSTRIETLQALIAADSESHGFNDFFNRATRHHVVCRREHEFEDGFAALWQIGGGVKGPLSVDYRDVHGMQEAGIDGGGLTKEFLTAMCKQAFHPDFGLFTETPERALYPNPAQIARSTLQLQHFEFLGRIIAKCIYEGILVDVTFAPFFLLNWIGKLAYIDDLQALDKDLYNGLIQLKNYTGDVENDLSLDFTVNEDAGPGRQATINLIANGRDTPVTKSNRLQYIHLMCHFKLNVRIARQSQAFVRGMSEVLDLRWLGMFNQNEMQALVGGAPVPIDIDDLRRNTVYGGFDERDLTVRIFWDVLKEFNNEERRKLVKFVTSTPRPPLLGFTELNPKFSLRNAGSDVQRLPTASTCVNLLKLPAYQSHEQMRKKLRLSITAEAGFDLS